MSLAERLKKKIQMEEEQSMQRFQRTPVQVRTEAVLVTLPRFSFLGKQKREQQRQEAEKRAEIEEDEENYRWQMSKRMIPEPQESNSSQRQEVYHCSIQENTEEHDHM
jgi:hypothetical protein